MSQTFLFVCAGVKQRLHSLYLYWKGNKSQISHKHASLLHWRGKSSQISHKHAVYNTILNPFIFVFKRLARAPISSLCTGRTVVPEQGNTLNSSVAPPSAKLPRHYLSQRTQRPSSGHMTQQPKLKFAFIAFSRLATGLEGSPLTAWWQVLWYVVTCFSKIVASISVKGVCSHVSVSSCHAFTPVHNRF